MVRRTCTLFRGIAERLALTAYGVFLLPYLKRTSTRGNDGPCAPVEAEDRVRSRYPGFPSDRFVGVIRWGDVLETASIRGTIGTLT